MGLNGRDIFGRKRLDFMFRLACSILGRSDEAEVLCDMVHAIVRKQYERISMVSVEGTVSQFYLYDPESAKKDMSFVMTVEGEGESVVMEIIGKFDVKDITRLSSIGQKK